MPRAAPRDIEASGMKQVLLLLMITALSACGGYHKAKRGGNAPAPRTISAPIAITPTVVGVTTPVAGQTRTTATRPPATVPAAPVRKPFARGPIQSACMSSERKARSRELCGCIQAVADDTLSNAEQRKAVGFYKDPHQAQVVRQSDRSSDEAFWKAYRAYGDQAKRVCG